MFLFVKTKGEEDITIINNVSDCSSNQYLMSFLTSIMFSLDPKISNLGFSIYSLRIVIRAFWEKEENVMFIH